MNLILNIFLLSFFVAATISAEAPTSGCNLITSEGKCFSYFFQSAINWVRARAKCQTWGGYLASIDSASEDVALHNYIENPRRRFSCWIGLNDRKREGRFVWFDGSNSSYRNWARNEPNSRGNEDCAENNWSRNLQWNDESCNTRRRCYFCSSRNVSLFGRIKSANSTLDELSNNTFLAEDTTLYCITENKNTPLVIWRYYAQNRSITVLNSTTDVTTGVSVLNLTSDKPGYYSCEVTRDNGVSRIYGVLMLDPLSFEESQVTTHPTATISTITTFAPQITSPNINITRILNLTDVAIGSIECVATGVPPPDIYWTRDFTTKFIDSPILQVNITDLSNDGEKVFYCVAENVAGKDVASVTYQLELTIETIQETLEEISDDLNGVESISDERSGETADLAKVIIDAANNDGEINDENRSMILLDAARVAELIINKTNGTFSDETAEQITRLLSSIVNGSSYLQESEQMNVAQQHAEQLVSIIPTAFAVTLNTLERFSQRLSENLTENREVNTVRTVESQLITVVVQNVALNSSGDGNDTKAEILLPKKSSEDVQYSVMVELSTNLAFNLSADGRSLAIATSITRKVERKNSVSKDDNGFRRSIQGSDILTIALEGKSGVVMLNENATLSFDVYSNEPSKSICAFLNGTNWISNDLNTDQKSQNFTNCISSHFTSFAVFVTPHEIQRSFGESIALSVISYLFVGISFISLLISLIIFISARKPFFKVEANIVYFNHCLSMLIATGLFIFGIQVGTYNIVLCKIIAFLLHYSWLAVFTWTLCIGILIMHKLVLGVLSTRKIYKYLMVFGWISPTIIPIITIAVARDYYVDVSRHCFLNVIGGVIWAFIIPIWSIILINAIFLIIAIIRIIQAKSNKSTEVIIKDALVAGLVLTPVLGLPWLILIFNVAIQHSVIEWVFIIVNGLMGLVFLLVVVLRNREVVAFLKKKDKYAYPTNTHKTHTGNNMSNSTANSLTSNRFKKNTLERQLDQESETKSGTIDLKSVSESPNNDEGNIYEVHSNVKETFKTFGHGKKVQNILVHENTAFTKAALDDLLIHKNLSSMEMGCEMQTNPIYLQYPVCPLYETTEIYSNIADGNESDAELLSNADEVEIIYESPQNSCRDFVQ